MSRRDLLERVSQPPRAASERKQNQRRFLGQIENFRECGECEIHVRSLTDGFFNNVAKLRVFRRQRKLLQQSGRPWIAQRIQGVPEPGDRTTLGKPVAYRHLRTGSIHASHNSNTPSDARPCSGPVNVARPLNTPAARGAPVDTATRVAKVDAFNSWSARRTSARRSVSAASGRRQFVAARSCRAELSPTLAGTPLTRLGAPSNIASASVA